MCFVWQNPCLLFQNDINLSLDWDFFHFSFLFCCCSCVLSTHCVYLSTFHFHITVIEHLSLRVSVYVCCSSFFLSLKLYYLCLYSVRSSIQLLAIYEQCSEDVNVIIYGTLCWWMLPFDVYSVFFCLFVCKFKGIHAWHQYIDTNNSWFIIFM